MHSSLARLCSGIIVNPGNNGVPGIPVQVAHNEPVHKDVGRGLGSGALGHRVLRDDSVFFLIGAASKDIDFGFQRCAGYLDRWR